MGVVPAWAMAWGSLEEMGLSLSGKVVLGAVAPGTFVFLHGFRGARRPTRKFPHGLSPNHDYSPSRQAFSHLLSC